MTQSPYGSMSMVVRFSWRVRMSANICTKIKVKNPELSNGFDHIRNVFKTRLQAYLWAKSVAGKNSIYRSF
jgi:hypothetical protein